jgi:integrase
MVRRKIRSKRSNLLRWEERWVMSVPTRVGSVSAKAAKLPAYCLHKPSGRAVVYLNRRAVYLGPYGSPESLRRYRQLVAQFAGPAARQLPLHNPDAISVAELVEQYLVHARTRYAAGSERLHLILAAVRPLLELHASTSVTAFGPLALEAVRNHRINLGRTPRKKKEESVGGAPEWRPLSRTYLNMLVQAIVRVFDWAAGRELVPVTIPAALRKLEPIRKRGEPKLLEPKRVRPVPAEHIEAVLRVVTPELQAMIRIQALTAMRPDEVTAMRPCDITTSGDLWAYTLGDRSHGGLGHKTDYLEDDGDKVTYLGPHAQRIIEPFLQACGDPTEFLFSPRRALQRRYPNGHGGLKPTAKYDDGTYCQAVKRACKIAGVPVWTPNQLRHSRATEVRKEFGLEAAQAVLDHRRIATTQIYAERQAHLKEEIARKIG